MQEGGALGLGYLCPPPFQLTSVATFLQVMLSVGLEVQGNPFTQASVMQVLAGLRSCLRLSFARVQC